MLHNASLLIKWFLPWPKGLELLCTAVYGPQGGSEGHSNENNAYYALDFDRPWEGEIMPETPILAIADGQVERVGVRKNHKWGCYVLISHLNGFSSLYAHLEYRPLVHQKDIVVRGQQIGFLGETGTNYGPHLHFQLFHGGKCLEETKLARPEPISEYGILTRGIWYRSNNELMKGGK
ncbi:M23 family metallopeptidase [Candidatus Falkowbacteria bacterium]|nr:M23 family metallopeptidase [Candidatus Falkowbacteria bacterium]